MLNIGLLFSFRCLIKIVNFYTLIEAAKLKNELAIGYKIASQSGNRENNYGIYLNPVKSKNFTLSKEDSIIVLAED